MQCPASQPSLRLWPLLTLLAALQVAADTGPLLDAGAALPGLVLEIRYAGAENFTGGPVAGYEAPRCLLSAPAVEALAQVQAALRPRGLQLLVYDCFRPQRAVDHFMRWTALPDDPAARRTYYPNVAKTALVAEGYIADRSGHSRGSTLDVTLATLDGEVLDMGSPWDFFDPLSWTESEAVPDAARENRLLLRRVMEAHGFGNYPQEWWHFTLRDEPFPDTYMDFPLR